MFLIPKKGYFQEASRFFVKNPKRKVEDPRGEGCHSELSLIRHIFVLIPHQIYICTFSTSDIYFCFCTSDIYLYFQSVYIYIYLSYINMEGLKENLCALDTWISFSMVRVLVLMLIAAANHNWQLGLLMDIFTFIIALHWLSESEMRFWMCKSLL